MNECDWCKKDWEVCGTCERFFDFDDAKRCASYPGEYGCAYYKPFGFCPKCGRKLKEKSKNQKCETVTECHRL